jgi:Serine/threonine protein phosphatase
MRRINSEFRTKHISEEGQKLTNRDYFGFVEMDDFACYVMADSLDEDVEVSSAKYVVESLIRSFVEHPTLRKRVLDSYIHHAHKELTKERKGMRLKASVALVVTDYKNLRYCYVGNSRFYLIRNGRFLEQTKDQSLTQNLIAGEKLALDQAAVHEERNNLYSYLGERGNPRVMISSKIKLENGDILTQSTRGMWENCSDAELLQAVEDAKEPQDILNRVEDLILEKQDGTEIDNYSLAVTLVSKVYQSPKKKFTIKQILMIAIPILIAICVMFTMFYIRQRSINTKKNSLIQYMESGETYLRYDNYKKASDEYAAAKKLASELNYREEMVEADQYLKLADQVILADGALLSKEYIKAQELYLLARELSVQAGNVGKKYIDLQLDHTRVYIELYDWINIGEIKEGYGDLEGAIEAYKTAKEKASALYANNLKEDALTRQIAAEEKLNAKQKAAMEEAEAAIREAQTKRDQQEAEQKAEKEKEKEAQAEEQEIENQQKANDKKNAIDLENKGNDLLANEQYEYAITFYRTAQAIYYRLGLTELADAIGEKIEAAKAGSNAQKTITPIADPTSKETEVTESGNTEEMKP